MNPARSAREQRQPIQTQSGNKVLPFMYLMFICGGGIQCELSVFQMSDCLILPALFLMPPKGEKYRLWTDPNQVSLGHWTTSSDLSRISIRYLFYICKGVGVSCLSILL